MQGYRLKGGSTGFKGNVISFPQDISDICRDLPRLPQSLKVVVARCKGVSDEQVEKFIDFRVRRAHVLKWLQFLKKLSSPYKDITINEDNLSQLPEDGSVFHQLAKRDEKRKKMKKGSENTEEATDHHFRHDSEDKIEEEDDDEQDYSD